MIFGDMRKRQKLFFAVRTADSRDPFLQITALEELVYRRADNRPPVPVALLVSLRIRFLKAQKTQ